MTIELFATGVISIVVALCSAVIFGRKSAKNEADKEELEEYVETRKRMDEAGRMSDADASRKWLRDRAKSGRDL